MDFIQGDPIRTISDEEIKLRLIEMVYNKKNLTNPNEYFVINEADKYFDWIKEEQETETETEDDNLDSTGCQKNSFKGRE